MVWSGPVAQSPPSLGTASQVLTVLHQLRTSAGGAATWCPGNLCACCWTNRQPGPSGLWLVWAIWARPSLACETWDRRVARFGRPLSLSVYHLSAQKSDRTHPGRHHILHYCHSIVQTVPRPALALLSHGLTEQAVQASSANSYVHFVQTRGPSHAFSPGLPDHCQIRSIISDAASILPRTRRSPHSLPDRPDRPDCQTA